MNDDDLLYHYTDAAGLLGMLGSSTTPACLWLSQIQYMNDAEEWYHAYDLGRQEILRREQLRTGLWHATKGLYGLMHNEAGGLVGVLDLRDSLGTTRYFTFSLSEERDLLSQWRGYAPGGGYSIGFQFGDLRELARRNGFEVRQCLYDDAAKQAMISQMVDQIEQGIREGFVDPKVQAGPDASPETKAIATASHRFQVALNGLATFFKHQSFAEEKEWRLVGIVGSNESHRARWRTRGNLILPYCCLDISISGTSPAPVRRVVIGPGVDPLLAKYSIDGLMWDREPRVQVDTSKCTLRL